MRTLKSLIILGGMVSAMLALDARGTAHAAPWCAWLDRGIYDCSYYTFQQCLATISGLNGYCARNVRETWDREPRPRRSKRVRY